MNHQISGCPGSLQLCGQLARSAGAWEPRVWPFTCGVCWKSARWWDSTVWCAPLGMVGTL